MVVESPSVTCLEDVKVQGVKTSQTVCNVLAFQGVCT